MSGGSYNYLCHSWDLEDVMSKKRDLQEMVDRLAGLGYAKDAAVESLLLLQQIRQFEVNVEVALKRLTPVWKAVEWWDSADSSEDSVKEALVKYRGLDQTS